MTKETTIERTHTTAAWEALKAIQGRAYKQGGLEGVLFMSASAFKESQAVQATCADKKMDARSIEGHVADHLTTSWFPRVDQALGMAPDEQR
jgi:hypothetical protein